MNLTNNQIQHIADLARIELTSEEKEKYAKELSTVLGFVEQLSEVNTDNILPTSQVTGLVNIVREDKAGECDKEIRQQVFLAAPLVEGHYFRVKAIF